MLAGMEASIRWHEPIPLIFVSGWLRRLRMADCPSAGRRCSLAWASARSSPGCDACEKRAALRRARWAGTSRRRSLAQWIFEEFRITIAKQTLNRELRAMGYHKLSVRPRHHAQAEEAIEDFLKNISARPVGDAILRLRGRPHGRMISTLSAPHPRSRRWPAHRLSSMAQRGRMTRHSPRPRPR